MAALASVYVATAERGVKVGYSNNHLSRFKQIASEIGHPVALSFVTEPVDDAAAVERLAHWYLRDQHIGGEWFSCGAGEAWDAVNRAIEGVARGEAPERRVGNATPFAELKTERLCLDMSAEAVAALDEWRAVHKIWSRSDAIRRLIAEGVKPSRERKRPDGGK